MIYSNNKKYIIFSTYLLDKKNQEKDTYQNRFTN